MKRYYVVALLLLCSSIVSAQAEKNIYSFDFSKLKPIVQVFGTAKYDVSNDKSDYTIGRAHLGFQYQFNEQWSAKLVVDRGRPTHLENMMIIDENGDELQIVPSYKEGSYYTMFLKFASLKWQVNDNFSLEGGAILQNHYITQEKFWGFRYVAQTFQDMYWHISSTDLGFMARYKLNDVISFDAAITNGEGSRVNQDEYGKVKYAAGLDVNVSKSVKGRLYYYNKQSGFEGAETEQMYSFFLGLKPSTKYQIGTEVNYMENLKNVDNARSYGVSLYGKYSMSKQSKLFVRYDKLMNEGTSSGLQIPLDGNAIIAGIEYSPLKNIHLSLNYQGWIADEVSSENKDQILLSMEFKL
ncbi:hypothetical protein DF185_05040 [Marinifilum breve]|uniref:Porin n=1 Tax=Marinifilum breve TaxID=2184082 RepID=A0A2V4A0B2_9BACT|nr:hypothetical protein [Marinifilum breve]PXY02016.1 hypothetical protein DF185_05040 [Marinifilum breve]